ncbi:MAG: hypothetical protein HC908_03190 [Calothrix sp. SM1_7_51]|nr:hypothetical protein [Calothrix sp. SM1_7_51]
MGCCENSGKTFAFVRVSKGSTIKDTAFANHWVEMKKNGLIRGAYYFFHPMTSDPVKTSAGIYESGWSV